MNITRTSLVSGITRMNDINITEAQLQAWESGQLIQKAAPQLSPAEREFIMTGITQDEWDDLERNLEEDEYEYQNDEHYHLADFADLRY